MKYLQDYIQEKQTECFKKHGVIFAFSQKQFEEQINKDVKTYVHFMNGGFCPEENLSAFIGDYSKIVEEGIAQDLADNGKEAVIRRELDNYECYYTGDIEGAVSALNGYEITEDEILEIFKKGRK